MENKSLDDAEGKRVKRTVVTGHSEDKEGMKTGELPGTFSVKYRAAQIRSQKGTGLGGAWRGAVTSDIWIDVDHEKAHPPFVKAWRAWVRAGGLAAGRSLRGVQRRLGLGSSCGVVNCSPGPVRCRSHPNQLTVVNGKMEMDVEGVSPLPEPIPRSQGAGGACQAPSQPPQPQPQPPPLPPQHPAPDEPPGESAGAEDSDDPEARPSGDKGESKDLSPAWTQKDKTKKSIDGENKILKRKQSCDNRQEEKLECLEEKNKEMMQI
ncbi:uncharacterized protein LOC129547558 [Moschus berezovskii]|uniref:uncharacterized protein LOC129547558 n=1 Tax=Moschus berezovskii TaxID=68408 RepID=UPI0024445319|nr:uncharacterized protein LOC129547558 [Moschus berezovskii]